MITGTGLLRAPARSHYFPPLLLATVQYKGDSQPTLFITHFHYLTLLRRAISDTYMRVASAACHSFSLHRSYIKMPSAAISPSAIRKPQRVMARRSSKPTTVTNRSYVFHRSVRSTPYRIKRASAQILHLDNGWDVLNASGGAAVTGIGHLSARVEQAMIKTLRRGIAYAASTMFTTDVTEDLARALITSTDGRMSKVVFYGSGMSKSLDRTMPINKGVGSEANEAAYKLAVQYHAKEKVNTERTRTLFIARDGSYTGATIGSLDISGHKARRELYEPALPHNAHHVSPCYSYRGLRNGEAVSEYVTRLKNELEQKIKDLGPTNVAAFICEPVVGAVSVSFSLRNTH